MKTTAEGIYRVGELDQGTVTGQLNQSPAMPCQRRLQTLGAVSP